MSFIGLKVPHEVARLLRQVHVPGDRVPEGDMHVTMVYLGKKVPIEDIGNAIVVTSKAVEKCLPFTCKLDHSMSFPKGDDGVPIICPVQSLELHKMRSKLVDAFDQSGVSYSKKFPEYKPHVTLSYHNEPGSKLALGPFEWSVYEIVLWGGDAGDERLSVAFPFSFPSKTATGQKLKMFMAKMLSHG